MPAVQLVEKVCFFKKVLVLNPYPQTPFPRKGAILLGLGRLSSQVQHFLDKNSRGER